VQIFFLRLKATQGRRDYAR